MLTSNSLYKIISSGKGRITTDDIPEGVINKYADNFLEGKSIGDIVIRNTPEEIPSHALLNGQVVHAYDHPKFFDTLNRYKNLGKTDSKYEFFNKSEKEYDEFLASNIFEQTEQHFCPYFVVNQVEIVIYEVTKNSIYGYVLHEGAKNTQVESGFVYTDTSLEEVKDSFDGWKYTGNIASAIDKYVKLPTYPTYMNGNIKSYFFIIVSSRLDDEKSSIRSVSLGNVETLEWDRNAYINNSGTLQNLTLDFGLPKGRPATISVGQVLSSPSQTSVTNVGTENDAIFNFVLQRGKQGPAGGVMTLTSIGETFPDNPNIADKHYDTINNIIYEYNNDWQELYPADDGMIYIYNNKVYHYNLRELVEFNNIINGDDTTILKNEDGKLTSVGTITRNGELLYDWIGTEQEWQIGRSTGLIKDNWVCFITND